MEQTNIKNILLKKNKHINGDSLDGFKEVTTPYKMWLSDDDIIIRNYINEYIKFFEKKHYLKDF